MEFLYPFLIAFIFIFFSELGDKTQILVLSFSSRNSTLHILLGVALGSLFSHGLAILFGSQLSSLCGDNFVFYLKLFTYCTFILFGFIGFAKLKSSSVPDKPNSKSKLIDFLGRLFKNCVFLVATTIAVGELGDKTFLASIGIGIEYPFSKVPLIIGSICGMVASDSIAIFLGKLAFSKISDYTIDIISNIIFILFGVIGILGFVF